MAPINLQLASAAVYRLLYANDCDIQSVICSFVLLNYLDWGKLYFTSAQMSELLRQNSGFQIPQAVVQEALLSKGRNYFTYDKKTKTFCKSVDCPDSVIAELRELIDSTKMQNEMLVKKIAMFIAVRTNQSIEEEKYEEISNALSAYLIGKDTNDYSELISEFLITEDPSSSYIKQVQSIKEGNIFLEGLSQEIIATDIYRNYNVPLTLYLETEILFHIYGLNGDEYSQIGNDFINIVNEINAKGVKNKPIVKLKFFPETYEEIEKYFAAAKDVIRTGHLHPNSGSAMRRIIDQCQYTYDVELLKENFFEELKKKGITIDSETNYKPYSQSLQALNLEDRGEIERLQNEFEEKWLDTDIERSLQLINYINSKRSNIRRDRGFLKIGHLLITGKGVTFAVANSIGKDERIRPRNGAQFATSIERITNLLWMSLNKLLRFVEGLPSSMNVIVHAQTFISRKLEGKLHSLYEQLDKEPNGKIDSETTSKLASSLYTTDRAPENITADSIESVTRILSLSSIDEYKNMMQAEHKQHVQLLEKVADLQKGQEESIERIRQYSEENARLGTDKEELQRRVAEDEEIKRKQQEEIDNYKATIAARDAQDEAKKMRRAKRWRIFWWIVAGILIVSAVAHFGWLIWIKIKDPNYSWSDYAWTCYSGIGQSLAAALIGYLVGRKKKK